jgi:hypothetical protein
MINCNKQPENGRCQVMAGNEVAMVFGCVDNPETICQEGMANS